jgi:hypothetical protein
LDGGLPLPYPPLHSEAHPEGWLASILCIDAAGTIELASIDKVFLGYWQTEGAQGTQHEYSFGRAVLGRSQSQRLA